MKNVIVIIDPKTPADLENVLRDAIGDRTIPSEVKPISDRAWLIDLQKSLGFFCGLLHGANTRDIRALRIDVKEGFHLFAPTISF